MTSPFKAFEPLFKPFGEHAPRVRNFIIDFHNALGINMNKDVCVMVAPGITDELIISGITNPLIEQSFIIDAVFEMLDGYSYEKLSLMMCENMPEAMKHLKVCVFNGA